MEFSRNFGSGEGGVIGRGADEVDGIDEGHGGDVAEVADGLDNGRF